MIIQAAIQIIDEYDHTTFYSDGYLLNSLEEFTPDLFNAEFLRIFAKYMSNGYYELPASGIEGFTFYQIRDKCGQLIPNKWKSTLKLVAINQEVVYINCYVNPIELPKSTLQTEQFLTNKNPIIRELAKQLIQNTHKEKRNDTD